MCCYRTKKNIEEKKLKKMVCEATDHGGCYFIDNISRGLYLLAQIH